MHHRQGPGFQRGKAFENPPRVVCIRNVVRKRPSLIVAQGLAAALDHAGMAQRFDVPIMVEQVGPEECALCFLQQDPGTPTVWTLGCG